MLDQCHQIYKRTKNVVWGGISKGDDFFRSITILIPVAKVNESHKTMWVENWVLDLPDSEDYKIVNEAICFHLTLVMIGQG